MDTETIYALEPLLEIPMSVIFLLIQIGLVLAILGLVVRSMR